MRTSITFTFLFAAGLASGCGPPESPTDGGSDASCTLTVELGTGTADDFVRLEDGDAVEVILGFQGFRMLRLSVHVTGTTEPRIDLGSHLSIAEGSIEIDRRDSHQRLSEAPGGSGVVEGWLFFFNDVPASELVGRQAQLEVVARTEGARCAGGARVQLELRDDELCIDADASVPDAGVLDGGVPDGAMTCGAP